MIVYIEWIDAASLSGWISAEDVGKDLNLIVCESMGYLVHEDDEKYVVSATKCYSCGDKECPDHIKYSDPIAIPKAWVKNVREVVWVE